MKKYHSRGAQKNLPNRFENRRNEEIEQSENDDEIQKIPTQIIDDNTRSILASNGSEDIPFAYSVNPYRGCEHGCIYCYARPYHEYLGYSIGLDFETKIVVKRNAAELLAAEFENKSYTPTTICFSGVTDPYQPLEKTLQLTRKCLEVCLEYRNPVAIITKSSLIRRDTDILQEMAKMNLVVVALSITSLKNEIIQSLEPRASSSNTRFETVKVLSSLGIPVGVSAAPIIPGLTDNELPAILRKAKASGASFASYTLLRLPYALKDLFLDFLERKFPQKASKVKSLIMNVRDGKLNETEHRKRLIGTGEYAELIGKLFRIETERLGLKTKSTELDSTKFRRRKGGQLSLFE